MTALAVMLIAMLVVQAPVAMVDRALHANGQTHAANAFAGPLAADLADHDHDPGRQMVQDRHEGDADGRVSLAVEDDRDSSPSQGAHHHHDGSSLLGLATSIGTASPWGVAVKTWPGRDTSLPGAEPDPRMRPPKTVLEHIA